MGINGSKGIETAMAAMKNIEKMQQEIKDLQKANEILQGSMRALETAKDVLEKNVGNFKEVSDKFVDTTKQITDLYDKVNIVEGIKEKVDAFEDTKHMMETIEKKLDGFLNAGGQGNAISKASDIANSLHIFG